MRRLLMVTLVAILVPIGAFAQSTKEHRGWGYGFAGVGGTSGSNSDVLFNIGGGGEGLIYRGLGAGAEIGYLSSAGSFGDGIGLASANLAYHFNRSSRVVPFVTGGASLAFRSGTAGGGNFGGGIQYWPKEHFGLRFEFRDHVFSSDSPHLFTFRVGVAFR